MFTSDSVAIYIRRFSERESQGFLVAVGPDKIRKEDLNSIPEYSAYIELVDTLRRGFPKDPDSEFFLRFAYAASENKTTTLLQSYLKTADDQLQSAGFVRGCLLATLNNAGSNSTQMSARNFLVLCYKHMVERIWKFCFEMGSLTIYHREINRLFFDRKHLFDQIEGSERSMQLRIIEMLQEIQKPVDEIQPVDLENILKEITTLYSRLSAIANSMRRDYIKAQNIFRDLQLLLKKWNETPVNENETNTLTEITYFERRVTPFNSFIERTETLMSQLDTLMNSVRTYLGIQQQKLSIAAQTSSQEQLVRLVNLQEALHKLEILIVAVYLTEIARIGFEAIAHEYAYLLTAIFIPIALVIAIIIGRLLHKA